MRGAASLSPGNLEGTLWARCARDDTSKRRPPCWGAVGCRAQESARRPSASGWGQGCTLVLTQQERREGWWLGCGQRMVPPQEPRAPIYAQDSPPGWPPPYREPKLGQGEGEKGLLQRRPPSL